MSISLVRAMFASKGIPTALEKYSLSSMTVQWRQKSGKKKSVPEQTTTTSRSTDGSPSDGLPDDRHTKTLHVSAPSARVDAVLKSALGLSRNKIEAIFYENKIRLNGEKIAKKSVYLQRGDEVDVVKGMTNGGLLTIARVEVLAIEPGEESVAVKVKRCKSLLVENYGGSNAWKEKGRD